MFAIVKIAGKQHMVEVGKKIKIEALLEAKEKSLEFSDILAVGSEKELKVGKPLVTGASVSAEIVSSGKDKKVLIVKHHAKKRYRRVNGHRQDITEVKITKINEK